MGELRHFPRRCVIGLLDYFDQTKRHERAVRKAGEKLASNISTPEGRQKAIEFLSGVGSEESVAALLMRFRSRITSEIADREEKEYVLRLVVESGPKALGPIREYLRREEEIRFPLTALAELAEPDECVATATELLDKIGSPLPRQRSKVIQLLQFLEDFQDERIAPVTLPLLREEDSDDLRVAAATVLAKQGESDEIRTALLEALVSEEESQRLRNAVLEILVDNGWGVQGYRKKVEALLPEGYVVSRSGVITRRGSETER